MQFSCPIPGFHCWKKKLSLLKLSPMKSDGRLEWRCCRQWRWSWGRWLSCRRGCRWWSRRWPGSRHWWWPSSRERWERSARLFWWTSPPQPTVPSEARQNSSLSSSLVSLQNKPNEKNLDITGSMRLQVWSSSNLNQTLNYWNNFSDRWYYRNRNTYNLVRQGQFYLRASENTWIWKLKRQRGLSYVLLASYWKKYFFFTKSTVMSLSSKYALAQVLVTQCNYYIVILPNPEQ